MHSAGMTAIPHAAEALTSASGRFELASARLLKAASGGGDGDIATPLVEMSQASAQYKAGISVLRFSDAMLRELIDLTKDPK